MKIVHGWVSEFVDLDPTIWRPERVADVLTDLGLEVEHIEHRSAALNRFVVGLVLECERHPNADKLSVCLVDVGESLPRTIVCGAANVAAGQFVPVALDGAVVPNGGFAIGKRMVRGVQSNGMICSREELGRDDEMGTADQKEDAGIWVLGSSGDSELTPGRALAEVIGQTEIVYDVAVTPNRADCLSHIGIARELQAYQIVHGKEIEQNGKAVTGTGKENEEKGLAGKEQQVENPTGLIHSIDEHLAPFYALQKITNVTIGPSPKWLQDRLTACGLRPRNVIVDITNYVNMELGQPLHAFDFAKVRGSQFNVQGSEGSQFRVQGSRGSQFNVQGSMGSRGSQFNVQGSRGSQFNVQGSKGSQFNVQGSRDDDEHGTMNFERFVTLDGKERTLPLHTLMICDMEGSIAIAGVMGGENSEIDVSTTDIVLESAYFDPASIRRTAKVLGLSSDASYRFERGVDPGNVLNALDRATNLILSLIPGSSAAERDVSGPGSLLEPRTIKVRFGRIRSILGTQVLNDEMINIFTALGCVVSDVTTDSCVVEPPTWRADLKEEIDFSEEVMRFYGINNINDAASAVISLQMPVSKPSDATGERFRVFGSSVATHRNLRMLLVARGYSDCLTTVLTSPENAELTGTGIVKVKNPLGVEFSALRTSLVPSLLTVASLNIRHDAGTIRLCEIGNVFTWNTNVIQREHLAVLITGEYEQHWSAPERELDLFDLLGDVGILGPLATRPAKSQGIWSANTVEVLANAEVIGMAGLVDPEVAALFGIDAAVFAAEISLKELDAVFAATQAQRVYNKIGQFPSVRRDLALIVDEEIPAGRIVSIIRAAAPATCRDVRVFDVYRDVESIGRGRKSVAVGLTFRSDVKTLIDEEIEDSLNVIIRAIEQELGALIRGSR
ncbi:MAG: phenylalanine--tRNA ligase subunit beta [Ignavibacteria bacterium]|nr:phenylalanine--tRNA ligase subunit beta [Ignavibacteria bacterium]